MATELEINGVRAVMEVSRFDALGFRTRWTARFVWPRAPRCEVRRDTDPGDPAFGSLDVVLGTDPRFDELFTVRSDRPDVVRRLWSPFAMTSLSGWFADATVRSDGKVIELVEDGRVDDAARIRHGLELVADLAARDFYGAGALAAIGGSGFSTVGGGPRAVIDQPTRVLLRTKTLSGHLLTVAQLAERTTLGTTTVELSGELDEAALTLPRAAQMYAHAVGPARLVVERGMAELRWLAVETDLDRLRTGVRLLNSLLVSGVGGMYR